MEILGKVKVINQTQNVSASFKKRELVVVTDEQYSQSILIEFNQDKCELLDKFKVGDSVKVGINLRGREWVNPQGETKYFNTIQGWSIFENGSSNTPTEPTSTKQVPTPIGDDSGLPF